jgi:hypothetical protein
MKHLDACGLVSNMPELRREVLVDEENVHGGNSSKPA